MEYGAKELIFAKPFADALVNDAAFRVWMIGRTLRPFLTRDCWIRRCTISAALDIGGGPTTQKPAVATGAVDRKRIC